jgi:hypothetical protein
MNASRHAKNLGLAIIAAVAVAGMPAVSNATPIAANPYPAVGHQNLAQYVFRAQNSGDIVAYFMGTGASYTETLGLLVNGVSTGIRGLNNHTATVGQSLDLGYAAAGSILTFEVDVATTHEVWYSTALLNNDHINHVFSSSYAGSATAPAGTYVAFEDLRNGGDFNYYDETFVFTNVSTRPAGGAQVPEPSPLLLVGLGLGLTAALKRRRA